MHLHIKMPRYLRKTNGITLVELIITITISLVVLLAILSLNQLNNNSARRIQIKSQLSNCSSAVKLYLLENKIKQPCVLWAHQLAKNCRWIISKDQPKINSPHQIKIICSISTTYSNRLPKNKYIPLHVKLLYENVILLEYNLLT